MQEEFCSVLINAINQEEANKISDALVKGKLVAGSLITNGPSRYWWEGEIIEKEYYNIQAFSLMKNKSRIITEVKKIHSDKCPRIWRGFCLVQKPEMPIFLLWN